VLEPYKIVRVYTTSLHTYGINYFHHSPINIEANFILCLARNSANRESFSMAFPHKCCLIKYFSKTIINNSGKGGSQKIIIWMLAFNTSNMLSSFQKFNFFL